MGSRSAKLRKLSVRNILATSLLLLTLSFPGELPADWLDIDAYYKTYSVMIDEANTQGAFLVGDSRVMGMVTNRLRTEITISPTDDIDFNVAYDFSPRIMDDKILERDVIGTGIRTEQYRAADVDHLLYPRLESRSSSFRLYQNLDRASIKIGTDPADIYIGRQAIAWGSARAINPTDIIAPFAYDELDVEDRIGVDAVRVRVPIGFMGEIDVGHVFGDGFHLRNSATFLRAKFYEWKTDISPVAVAFRKNLLVGISLSRSIGGAGSWLEAAFVEVDAFESEEQSIDNRYVRVTLGMDYSLRDGTYFFGEYHYNGAGTPEPNNYVGQLSEPAFTEGAVYLMGEHYVIPGISYPVTPLVTLSGEALVNVTDPSALFAPSVKYNVAENAYLSTGAYIGAGESACGPGSPLSGAALPGSEFGLYPDLYFISVQVYF